MASVLVVEDEPSIQNAYNLVLSKRGFEVATADNAERAIELIGQQVFDVILLDLLMPNMSGLDLLREIKPKSTLPKTRILILSNTESPKVIQEALELSGGEYVLKVDCTPAEVADKVTAMLSRA